MITWTNLYTRAADVTGVSTTAGSQDLTNLQMDINQGLRVFKNAARRYWTRVERSTALVENQQYYQLPPDCVRVTEVRVNSSGLNFPVNGVDSEAMWNRINIIPAMTINLPMYYFIKGFGEIGLWPIPSEDVANGLVISYEPRLTDMSIDDVTTTTNSTGGSVTCTVSAGTNTVTFSGNAITSSMVGRWFQVNDGSDGNWYQIGEYTSTSAFKLVNDYQGISGSSHTFIIGQAPDIPEDYQLGLVYYAAYNFYLKRKDTNTSTLYKGLFEDLLTQYKETYAAKTTGQVQQSVDDYRYSLFTLPPSPII